MSTQTLRPNGTRSGAGDFTVTGAVLVHVALNDDKDTSYVQRTSTDTTKSFVINMATYSLGVDEAIESVRIGVRMTRGGAQAKLYVRQGYVTDEAAGTIRYAAADQYTGALSTLTTVWGAARTVAPDGQPWDQTRLNNLVVKVTDYSPTGTGRSDLVELYAEVVVNTRPTVTVDAPSGTVTDTSRPAIAWTYADTDGDPQAVYQVRVFDAATYSAAGFDPDTATPQWDSGLVQSSDPGVTSTVDLGNEDDHRAYVRVGHDLGPTVFLSAWAYSAFRLEYEAPDGPVLSASYSTRDNVVYVTAQGSTNLLSADDASLEGSIGTWVEADACTVARTTAFAASGSASLVMTATAAEPEMQAVTGLYPIPTNGREVTARAEFRPDAAAREIRVAILWFDAADAFISADSAYGGETANVWTAVSVTAYPPSGATQAQVLVEVGEFPASGEKHYVDKIFLGPGVVTTWSPGGLHGEQEVVVERSIDDGATWGPLATVPINTATQVAQADDYAAVRDAANLYRARIVGYAGQDAVASAYSATAAAWVPNDGAWWIKAPDAPTLNVGQARVLGGSPLSQSRDANVGVFRPLGRSSAVVVTGDVYGYDGTYDVLAVGEAEWAALEALLLDYTGDLIVQSPFGETRTIRVTSRSVTVDGTPTLPRRVVSVGYVEV